MSSELLDIVMDYHRRGWCIIPVLTGKKYTSIKWKIYQEKRPTPEQLKSWFRGNRYSPAVIPGAISGGLICRDFDVMDSFHRWQSDYPDLAAILPTVKTARGAHVYFQSDWTGFCNFDDGELRGDSRHYCLAPPAIHPDGSQYKWIVPLPPGNLPIIDPFQNGLGPPEALSHVTEENRRKQKVNKSNIWGLLEIEKEQIEHAIAETLPQREGQRNRSIFHFARKLKGLKCLSGFVANDMEPLVREWYTRALPFISTKAFVETWIDFLKGWPNIKFPVNEEFLTMILEQAKKQPLQQWDDERVCVLAAICRELGRLKENREFYIATRTAGKLLEVSHTQISRWLFLLEHDGIIQTLTKGGTAEAPRKATRFRYVGSD